MVSKIPPSGDSFIPLPDGGKTEELGEIQKFCALEIEKVKSFLTERLTFPIEEISSEELKSARELSSGVSSAKLIHLRGRPYILKDQSFSPVFEENLRALLGKGEEINLRKISESDDSFAHFPIKEVIGFEIAKLFNLNVPQTMLVRLPDGSFASIQEFIPKDLAQSMLSEEGERAKSTSCLSFFEIEQGSMINSCLFQIICENIDGHCGNILLKKLPEVEDKDSDEISPSFEAIPIDYGLLFPRHDSIYPREINLVKKGLYKFIENKKFNIKEAIEKIPEFSAFMSHRVLADLMTDFEKMTLQSNLNALFIAAERLDNKVNFKDFLDLFIQIKIQESAKK